MKFYLCDGGIDESSDEEADSRIDVRLSEIRNVASGFTQVVDVRETSTGMGAGAWTAILELASIAVGVSLGALLVGKQINDGLDGVQGLARKVGRAYRKLKIRFGTCVPDIDSAYLLAADRIFFEADEVKSLRVVGAIHFDTMFGTFRYVDKISGEHQQIDESQKGIQENYEATISSQTTYHVYFEVNERELWLIEIQSNGETRILNRREMFAPFNPNAN